MRNQLVHLDLQICHGLLKPVHLSIDLRSPYPNIVELGEIVVQGALD
jgi:hypothetical protein